MSFDAHKNLATGTVLTAPTPATSGTSLTVGTGEGARFPTVPFNATVSPANVLPTPANAEIVRVTNVSGDILTITRAQELTSARNIIVTDQISNTITAKVLTDVESGTNFPILEVDGDSNGVAAFAGDRYSHVLVSAGLNANPLTANHQVAFYTGLFGNSNTNGVNGFVSAFESGIGLAAGAYTVGKIAAFAVGNMGPFGAGAAATRTWGLSTYDQTAGTNNATMAPWDSTFTGNWYIHYEGTRDSKLAGNLLTGPEIYRPVANGFLRLAGGSSGGGGGHVALFGESHATLANQGQLNATGGWSISGDFKFVDATYDIGKSGATRPRDGFFSRNFVIGGTMNVVGVVTLSSHVSGTPTFVAGDKYLLVNSTGVLHVSALGPAS